jgi:hypothetical protein
MEFFLWIIVGLLANDAMNNMDRFDPFMAWMFRIIVVLLVIGTIIERYNKYGKR